MRAHILQHVAFEGPGTIGPWLAARGAEVRVHRLFEDARLPEVADLDWLVVMGGPMGANDDDRFAWLAPEVDLIASAVARGKVVLGICLGAQLLARALGARVYANPEREIGWFPVEPVGRLGEGVFGGRIDAFHWHGDTFDLPDGARHLARSAGCEHQAFSIGPRVLGLQFHLETTLGGATALVEQCAGDLRPGKWVQSAEEILGNAPRFTESNARMTDLLERLASGSLRARGEGSGMPRAPVIFSDA